MHTYQTKRGTRAVAFLLSALMLCSTLPANAFAAEQTATANHEITSFAPLGEAFEQLGEGAYVHKVATGTSFDALGLPAQLTVSVNAMVADAPTVDAPTADVPAADAPAAGGETDIAETPAPLSAAPTLVAVTKEQTLSVQWQSLRSYDANAKGVYVFHPVLPEGYSVADGVAVPRVYVSIPSPTCICAAACTENAPNAECPDCAVDYQSCSYFPESCVCDAPCDGESLNTACPFCAQGAENCTFTYGLAFGNYAERASLFGAGPVVTDSATYDVYMHVDPSWRLNSSALKALVEQKLQTLIDSEPTTKDYTYRIHTSSQSIDTTDLRYWYVYDHYDTAVWGNDPTVVPTPSGTGTRSWNDVYAEYKMYGDSGRQRPFQIVKETAVSTPTTTIEALLNSGSSLNTAQKLAEHIYAGNDGAGSFMTFVGYGNDGTPSTLPSITGGGNDFTDFLFYPATSLGQKTVEFTVNASEVEPHSLESAGFLCNAGIEEPPAPAAPDPQNGLMSGYLVSIGYQGNGRPNPPAGTKADAYQYIRLYKINDNITSAQFSHFAKSGMNLKLQKYATMVGEISPSNLPTFNAQSDIRLTIDETAIKLEMRQSGDATYDYTHEWTGLEPTGYQGFGPYVAYEDDGHTCNKVSAFRFSDLKMSFSDGISSGGSLLAPVRSANYLDKSGQRFFVDLVDDGADVNYANAGAETELDKAYAGLLKSGDIALITNKTSTPPDTIYPEHYLGGNAMDIHTDVNTADSKYTLIDNGTDTSSLNRRAAEIAWLIYNYERDTTGGQSPESPSTATAELWLMDGAPGDTAAPWTGASQVNEVQKELIEADKLKVYLNPDKGRNVSALTPKYTFKTPDGTAITPDIKTGENGKQYFEIDGTWAIGEYTVKLDYDPAAPITTVLPAQAKFTIKTDKVAPAVTAPTDVSMNAGGKITATVSAVNTPSTGTNVYTAGLASYAVVVSTSAAAPAASTIADSAKIAITERAPLPATFTNSTASTPGTYYVHVYVWDGAGNVGTATSAPYAVVKMPQTLEDNTDYTKFPQNGDGYYILELGRDTLPLNVTNTTNFGGATPPDPMLDFSIAENADNTIVALQDKQYTDGGKTGTVTVVPQKLGNTTVQVSAAGNAGFTEAADTIKIKVVPPFSVSIEKVTETESGVTVKPAYEAGAYDVAEGALLQFREVGTDTWVSVPAWNDAWSATGYEIPYDTLKSGATYEVKITAQDKRTPDPTQDDASLTFTTPLRQNPQTLEDGTDYSKLPQKTPDGYYVLELGRDTLPLSLTNGTVAGPNTTLPDPMLSLGIQAGESDTVIALQNTQYVDGGKTVTATVVPQTLGSTIISVTAKENNDFYAASGEIKIKVVPPLTVSITAPSYDSTGITVLPGNKPGAYGVADGATLKFREIGTDNWVSVPTWDGAWSSEGYHIPFDKLTPGKDYEVKITAKDNRTPSPTQDDASLTFTAPKADGGDNGAGTGSGSIEGEVTDVPQGKTIITTLKKGDQIVSSNSTKSPVGGGTVEFAFTGLPDGKYNVVISDEDGNTRTQEVILSGGKVIFPVPPTVSVDYKVLAEKKTIVRFDASSTVRPPVVVVDQLNEQYDAPRATQDNRGVTQADMDSIATVGGSALIELFVTGVEDSAASPFAADIQSIKNVSGQRISQLVDLTLFKTIIPAGTLGTTTQLLESNALLKISVPLENFRNYRTNVYRVHEDGAKLTEKLPTTPSASGEYYEIEDGYLILHVKKFSLYAVTYSTRSDAGGETGNTGNSDATTYPVTPDKSPVGGTVSADKGNGKAGETVTVTAKPDNGYTLEDLTVTDQNGNKIPVKDNGDGTFTFTMPSSGVTVSPTFRKTLSSLEQTGVGKLLNADDHKLYLIGDTNGNFRPEANMTRAEVAQMFYRLLKNQNVAITASFSDVAADAWYAKPVLVMASLGMVKGNNGSYRPEDPVTRAEFTAIAMRFANVNDGKASFSDVPSTHWAYDAIGQASSYGWINGMADGTFRPEANITRTQVARIVNGMLVRIADEDYVLKNLNTLKIFPDAADQSYWGWLEIVESTNGHNFKVDGHEVWTALKGA